MQRGFVTIKIFHIGRLTIKTPQLIKVHNPKEIKSKRRRTSLKNSNAYHYSPNAFLLVRLGKKGTKTPATVCP